MVGLANLDMEALASPRTQEPGDRSASHLDARHSDRTLTGRELQFSPYAVSYRVSEYWIASMKTEIKKC